MAQSPNRPSAVAVTPKMGPSLLILIPQFIEWATILINAIKSDPGTPAETTAKLDAIYMDLQRINVDVQAVQLPDKQ